MIADVEDKNPTQARFGDGKLLSNLLKYDPQGKFVFVGDECQLFYSPLVRPLGLVFKFSSLPL